MATSRALGCCGLLVVGLVAQQPNTVFAGLTIDSNDGPLYPMNVNVRNNTPANVAISGVPGAKFLIGLSANGQLQPFSAPLFGDKLDLPFNPPIVPWFNGYFGPGINTFFTNSLGDFSINVNVPGSVAVGTNYSLQALVDDPASPFGVSLTAATQVTVTQGPTVTNLVFGDPDEGVSVVDLAPFGLTIPFYGVNYTKLHVHVNGYVVPSNSGSASGSDFVPTAASFASGPPRIAPLWVDQILGTGLIQATIDPNPPGQSGFVTIDYQNVQDFPGVTTGSIFNYDIRVDANGQVDINHPFSMNPSTFYIFLVGMTAGGNLGPNATVTKDLSALDNTFYLGAANENFFELFQSIQGNPGLPSYDVQGRTLTFFPNSPGALPQSTSSYVFF